MKMRMYFNLRNWLVLLRIKLGSFFFSFFVLEIKFISRIVGLFFFYIYVNFIGESLINV